MAGDSQLESKRVFQVLEGRKIIMVRRGEAIEIRAYKEADLTEYFDSVPVDLDSDLSDWHSVRRELREQRPH